MDKIAVIGLGYVGLPLARLFATKYHVIGFDINRERVDEVNKCFDRTTEINSQMLLEVVKSNIEFDTGLFCTTEINDIKNCNIYIVTVPTPVDKNHRPDLSPLYKSSETVGKVLKKGDIVIYESTVYPGVTEEECVPVLEKISNLVFNIDFFVGYSPERINPGDKERTVERILKVTSGSTAEIGKKVDELYASVIKAGTYLASSIKVAEASKVIENSQRDINIAFVNELAKIFELIGIDTHEVLEAASTKWNFLQFKPGLVGGHCIGVDPYYLAQKAQEVGYYSEIILAGRRINDSMGAYVAKEIIKVMIDKNIMVKNSDVLILGVTFKENCPDVRNTKIVDLVKCMMDFGVNVDLFDEIADKEEFKNEYGYDIIHSTKNKKYDAVILGVAHDVFLDLNIESLKKEKAIVYDIKGILNRNVIDKRL